MYVTETVARKLYFGFSPPENEEELDDVALNELPSREFDKCGFIDVNPKDDVTGAETGEPEEVGYMSSMIKTSRDYFNTEGIISPIFEEFGIDVEILYDDMVLAGTADESLMIEDKEGQKVFFVQPFEGSSASHHLIG